MDIYFENGKSRIESDLNLFGEETFEINQVRQEDFSLKVDLKKENGKITGKIENLLEFSIYPSFLLYEGMFYSLPALKKGKIVSLDIDEKIGLKSFEIAGFEWSVKRNQEWKEKKIIGLMHRPWLSHQIQSAKVDHESSVLTYNM
jgi:hypothetical protein